MAFFSSPSGRASFMNGVERAIELQRRPVLQNLSDSLRECQRQIVARHCAVGAQFERTDAS